MAPATAFPWVTYADAHAAIDFLQRAFGGEPGRIAPARAREAGAEVNTPPRDLGYTREYATRDPEGNVWHFGTYQPLARG